MYGEKTEAPDPRFDRPVEEKLRDQARDKEEAAGLSQGTAGRAYENRACRPSLRERVNSSFYHARSQADKCAAFHELADLLDANPAIARILELIEATGV